MISKIFSKLFSIYNKSVLEKKLKSLGRLGFNSQIQYDIKLSFPEKIRIGNNVYIGPSATLNGLGEIEVKDGSIIGPNVYIHTANHRFRDAEYLPYDQFHVFKKVTIEENVWIGANVCISPGTTIGEGSIIGMGAVVSGKIPPLSIVVGNPCKVISKRDEEHYFKLKKQNKNYLEAKSKGIISPNYFDSI